MKSEMSVIHMPIAIAKIIFAQFQMAILQRILGRLQEDDRTVTHMRRTHEAQGRRLPWTGELTRFTDDD